MTLALAAKILMIAYGAMLCAVGFAGIFIARWELAKIFKLNVAAWPRDVAATFLNQYRFLKAVELGSGFFCLAFLTSILEGATPAWVFLALVAAGVVARGIAWIADGRPSLPFIVFLVLEALVFTVVALHLGLSHAD